MKLFFFHLIPSVCMGFNHSSHVTSWQQTLACLGKVLLNSPLCQADSTTNRHAYKDDYHSIHPGQARRSRVPLLTMLVVASVNARARDREKSCHFLTRLATFSRA
jgi:hypothetical protein